MTLEKHITDTIKEWQIKIGSLDTDIRLYYPKASLCRYLNLDINTDNVALCRYIEKYFADDIKYLGNVAVSVNQDKFCILVCKEGCEYVEKQVPEPEFLTQFLKVLKGQDMQGILQFFEEYAEKYGTAACTQKEEEGTGTVLYFEDESIEPYMYCIEQNEFGVTYHRFARCDFIE